jgi:hydrogenase expression/formation protein HypC
MCLAIPGRVVETYHEHDVRMGKVDFGGIFKRVCLEHVPDAAIDDYVLVHVGFALSRIDEAEAMRVFEFLGSMDQLDELGEPSEIDAGKGPSDARFDPPGPEPRVAAAARPIRGGTLP